MKFNFEKWLIKHTYFEEVEQTVLFSTINEKGGIAITDFDNTFSGEGKTLEEACENYCKNGKDLHRHYPFK
jgi:hypothetical protein